MRLHNIYYICKITVDSLRNVKLDKRTNHGRADTYTVREWKNALESMMLLRKIPFLEKDVDRMIESVPVYTRNADVPEIDNNQQMYLEKQRRHLVTRLETVIDLYESMERGEASEGIDIKIPKCDSFKEYIQYMKDIDFVFSQCPFISKCDEQIVFNTVDVGSMWLSFFIKATVGKHFILTTLSKMSELALKVKSNNVVIKQQEEMLITMQQKNEIGKEVIDTFKKMKEKFLDDAVVELEEECEMSLADPEERDRARRTLETYATLIEKGVEIYSAIETPEEIKVQFPFSNDTPEIPEGLLKLIEDKQKEE
uniref:hypothetical protein n=1 Tax=Acetatifactor sp. TaxID=1872090 RepID=UPI0040564239